MKKFLTSVVFLAALTALILAGCGRNSDQISSTEGLDTFGSVTVIPSAVPSTGVMTPSSTPQIAAPTSKKPNNVVEGNTQASAAPASPSPSAATVPAPSYFVPQPTVAPEVSPEPSPSEEPLPNEPAPYTTADINQALNYVGQPLSKLIEELGYPTSSDYEPVDEANGTVEANGTLYFAGGYTATTYRAPDGTETITSINAG